jgi:hypothetical protein
MSCQHFFRRVMSILGLLLFASAPAYAQVSEPEFVPYVNDVQIFDQPDLSPYGQGVRMPSGWFGSAEYVNWSIQSPQKSLIGIPTTTTVYGPTARTINTGTLTGTNITTFITQTVPFSASVVTVTLNGIQQTGQAILSTTTIINPSTGIVTAVIVTPATLSIPVQLSLTTTGQQVISSTSTMGTFTNSSAITQQSSMDTGYINSDFTSGSRFEFGRVVDGRGWMVSTFNLGTQVQKLQTSNVSINFANGPVGFVDIQGARPAGGTTGNTGANTYFTGDGYDDDLDGDNVYGRFGRDRGTGSGSSYSSPLDGVPDPENPGAPVVGVDYDDAVRLPTVFKSITVENRTSLYGVELDRIWQVAMGPRGGIWEFFAGPRYINLKDQFNVSALGDNTNPRYYLNPISDSYWNTRSENSIFGGQIGSRWAYQQNRWQVAIESRFLAAANFQSTRQAGQFGSLYETVVPDPNAIGGNNNGATTPRYDDVQYAQLPHQFNHSVYQTVFTPAGELRVNLKYQVFRSVYLQLGYTALYAHNIARSARMVQYNFPNMGIVDNRNDAHFFVNGVNFGVVINR